MIVTALSMAPGARSRRHNQTETLPKSRIEWRGTEWEPIELPAPQPPKKVPPDWTAMPKEKCWACGRAEIYFAPKADNFYCLHCSIGQGTRFYQRHIAEVR